MGASKQKRLLSLAASMNDVTSSAACAAENFKNILIGLSNTNTGAWYTLPVSVARVGKKHWTTMLFSTRPMHMGNVHERLHTPPVNTGRAHGWKKTPLFMDMSMVSEHGPCSTGTLNRALIQDLLTHLLTYLQNWQTKRTSLPTSTKTKPKKSNN